MVSSESTELSSTGAVPQSASDRTKQAARAENKTATVAPAAYHAPPGPPYAPMSLWLPSGSVQLGDPASMHGLPLASV